MNKRLISFIFSFGLTIYSQKERVVQLLCCLMISDARASGIENLGVPSFDNFTQHWILQNMF